MIESKIMAFMEIRSTFTQDTSTHFIRTLKAK